MYQQPVVSGRLKASPVPSVERILPIHTENACLSQQEKPWARDRKLRKDGIKHLKKNQCSLNMSNSAISQ